jgi:hypothetical protein
MGARCHVKDATGVGSGAVVLGKARVNSDRDQQPPAATHPLFFTFRKSHTFISPSSLPLRSRYAVLRLQLITLTSLLCAVVIAATFFLPLLRTSHIRMLWSAEHDAKTVASLGLHCMSSTLDVCEVNGVFCVVKPVGVLVVR